MGGRRREGTGRMQTILGEFIVHGVSGQTWSWVTGSTGSPGRWVTKCDPVPSLCRVPAPSKVCAFPWVRPHLIHGYLVARESARQTGSRLVQPF